MSSKDRVSKQKVVQTITSANLTGNGTTTTSATVDHQGYKSATHIVNVGVSGDSLSGSLKSLYKLQESDDDVSYTDVEPEDVIACRGDQLEGDEDITIDAPAEDPVVLKFGYIGHKRYTQLVIVRTGNHSTGTPVGAVCVLDDPDFAPVNAAAS